MDLKQELTALQKFLTRNKDAAITTVINLSTTVSGLGGIAEMELTKKYARKYRGG